MHKTEPDEYALNIGRIIGFTIVGILGVCGNTKVYDFFFKIVDYVKNFVIENNFFGEILDVAFKHELLDFEEIKNRIQNGAAIEW